MNEQMTPRERLVAALTAEKRRPHMRQMIDGITSATWDEADAVIAHLWEQPRQPEVLTAVARVMYPNGFIDSLREYVTERTVRGVLTVLIGPRPNGGSDESN